MATEDSVLRCIEAQLSPMGFVARPTEPVVMGVEIARVWARKTWNTNRGVVLLRLPRGAHPGRLSQQLKIRLGKAIGYFPFFYGLGLQLVWAGTGIATIDPDLSRFVDRFDNQRAIVQSLFVIDLDRHTVQRARTWVQVVTGKFQDATERGIRDAIGLEAEDGGL
jgi:hypothetical protein